MSHAFIGWLAPPAPAVVSAECMLDELRRLSNKIYSFSALILFLQQPHTRTTNGRTAVGGTMTTTTTGVNERIYWRVGLGGSSSATCKIFLEILFVQNPSFYHKKEMLRAALDVDWFGGFKGTQRDRRRKPRKTRLIRTTFSWKLKIYKSE